MCVKSMMALLLLFPLFILASCDLPFHKDLYSLADAPPTFGVTYNANGASGTAPVNNNYAQGVSVTVTTNSGTLVYSGYALAGWMTKPDGAGISYLPGATFTMGSANVTLYAVWVPQPYALKLGDRHYYRGDFLNIYCLCNHSPWGYLDRR